jgi:uncharacterized OsmC-like protein
MPLGTVLTSGQGRKQEKRAMLHYSVHARRIDGHSSVASAKQAEIRLDTDINGNPEALNPAELLLASLAACMIKGVERVTPMLDFKLSGVEVHLTGIRQDSPPKMLSIAYEIVVDTDETQHRLDLLHVNIRKYGTISNTLAAAIKLEGTIRPKT